MLHTIGSIGPTSESVISSDASAATAGNNNNNGNGYASLQQPSSNGASGQTVEDKDGQHHPVPEFLCQLTKMLTDDDNEHIIDWRDAKIRLHDPSRVEEILGKYFRHSKFASFQRQLNYFGFRKIAGKGKYSPCAYTNDAASSDIRSLLLIKRKTNGSAARKLAAERAMAAASAAAPSSAPSSFFPMVSPTASAAAALNAQLGLLALQHQHQQLQAQMMQQQQKAILEQQQKALIEQHKKVLMDQQKAQQQQQLQQHINHQALTAATLGQGGNAAASAVMAAATAMAATTTRATNPATAALAALGPPELTLSAPPLPPQNVFESAANLKSLLDEQQQHQQQQGDLSQLLLQRLPSQSTIFPEASLLSLTSYFSRNNSVAADLDKKQQAPQR